MSPPVILDTGPLVAFLNRRDRHHDWARKQWARVAPPFLTCEAVVAEACFLAHRLTSGAGEAVVSLVERGVLDLSFRLADEAPRVARLMKKYDDVPMSLADACLVRMSQQNPGSVVLTLDGDFRIYRRSGRQSVPVRMPGGQADGRRSAHAGRYVLGGGPSERNKRDTRKEGGRGGWRDS